MERKKGLQPPRPNPLGEDCLVILKSRFSILDLLAILGGIFISYFSFYEKFRNKMRLGRVAARGKSFVLVAGVYGLVF